MAKNTVFAFPWEFIPRDFESVNQVPFGYLGDGCGTAMCESAMPLGKAYRVGEGSHRSGPILGTQWVFNVFYNIHSLLAFPRKYDPTILLANGAAPVSKGGHQPCVIKCTD
jgi:hypothetical protein